jgi:hypothetical protein
MAFDMLSFKQGIYGDNRVDVLREGTNLAPVISQYEL